MKRSLSLFAVLLLITLLFTACGKKGDTPQNKYGLSTRNNVVWWVAQDITNIIPYLAHDAAGQYASNLVWEPLNYPDQRTQDLIPWLASLPEMTPDHLTYTYTMNPKAHWSDGKPVIGEDVMFSFKCVMNPRQIETTQSRSVVEALDSITYVNGDKMKVAFHLSHPYFQMDRVLGGGYILILPKHVYDPDNLTDQMSWKEIKSENPKNPVFKKQADQFIDPSRIRDPKFMVGSNAYIYKDWITNDHATFTRDTNYWGKDMPWAEAYPDEITLKTISDNNAAVTALKAKDIDFMDLVPSALYAQLDSARHPYIKKDTVYYNSRTYVEWNNENPLFKSKKVRWALSHLINRDQIIKEIYKGLAWPTNSVINFTQPHYDASLKPIEFNPELAKSMLAEEGWTAGADGMLYKNIDGKKTQFAFTFNLPAGSDVVKQAALVISEQMRKVGIKAEVDIKEWSVWINNARSHDFDAAIANLGGNATEDDDYELYHSSQAENKGQNVMSYKNPEVDKILLDNRTSFDFKTRDSLMKKFQQIMYEDMPITPLFSQPVRLARVDRFDNVEYFHQRPCVNIPYWIVRGSGAKVKPGAISNYQPHP